MNKSLRLLLELEELVMLRESVECTSAPGEEPGVENLLEKIDKIRRRVPGSLLSEYDKLARAYSDTVSIVSGGVCQACEGRISGRLYHLVGTVEPGGPVRTLRTVLDDSRSRPGLRGGQLVAHVLPGPLLSWTKTGRCTEFLEASWKRA
jgi:hypothetical protein